MDMTGQRYGMLTVLELKVATPYRKKSYLCKCDCGKTCIRLESTLHNSQRDGRISSCGCYPERNLKKGTNTSEQMRTAGLHRKDTFVDGCNVQMTFREGTVRTNTSGYQGISWSNSAHKWHCYIGYKLYRANLGYYENIEDAVKIRKLAEEAIKDKTFEDFFYGLRGHRLGEKEQKYASKSTYPEEY